jgi:acyl-CoA dehydrogenase
LHFTYDPEVERLRQSLLAFMDECVYPAEHVYHEQARTAENRWDTPPVIDELKAEARSRGLWNLFLPDPEWGSGLSNLAYAPLAEITGRSPFVAPEALNCSAPDTGNMEILAHFATPAIRERWLRPLLEGEIRTCFSMTEPAVASSDATNIATRIERTADGYVINGRKWWSSGAMSPRCKVAVVMGVSDPDADRHRRHSMVVVPLDTPGVEIERSTSVFGYDDGPHGGHAVIHYNGVEIPRENLLGEEGGGFAIAQARLGPGRIHHCMRLIGMAERGLDLMCARASERQAFGKLVSDQGVVRSWIADARIDIEQLRLLVLKTAWLIDTVGAREAMQEISAIKVAAPEVACQVLDRAIQVHGGAGVSQDTPLAQIWSYARILRLADGPDEVHREAIARRELRRAEATRPPAAVVATT